MWCSPTASPQTHPSVFFFPTSVGGFLSSSATPTLPLPLSAIVAADMQPAMPAPTTTTSVRSIICLDHYVKWKEAFLKGALAFPSPQALHLSTLISDFTLHPTINGRIEIVRHVHPATTDLWTCSLDASNAHTLPPGH